MAQREARAAGTLILWGTVALAPSSKQTVVRRWSICLGAALWGCSIALGASQQFFPVQDIRAGLRGIGKTVFQGDRIEDFQVEILGVLEDFGPRQPIILARLSGGPLAETGILQGMSGSPVYIDGKLVGAVALGFPFSKEPIAGIQPIESMLAGATGGGLQDTPPSFPILLHRFSYGFDSLLQLLSSTSPHRNSPFGDISEIQTPISVSGSQSGAVTNLDAAAHRFGVSARPFDAYSRVGAAAESSQEKSAILKDLKPTALEPGSMISVGLITGDWNMTADGTVTYIDGDKVYAFGHRFLNIGAAEMPFAFSDVLASVPSTNTSFKISSPRQWIGTIVSDHSTGIAGELGRAAHTIPVQISVTGDATGARTYRLQLVNDRLLTPFLAQAALFSTLEATKRTTGTGTLKIEGEVHFDGNLPPLVVHDLFVSDSGLAQQASADAVVTLAFVLGGGFRDLHVKDMDFRMEQVDSKKQLRLAQVWTSAHGVRAGETVEITALLQGENGVEVVKTIPYAVPAGAPLGALNLTLSDGNTLNFPEFAGIAQSQFRTAANMIEAVNRYRDSGSLYVRVWRQQPAFNVTGPMPGGDLSDPPPSVVLVLTDTASSASGGASATTRGSDVAQLRVPTPGYVVTGAKTIQIEVIE